MEREFSAVKPAMFAALSAALTAANIQTWISIVAGLVAIGYGVRKWWALERWLKKKKADMEGATEIFTKDE